MANPLIRKLEGFVSLNRDDKDALDQAVANHWRVGARKDLVREGDAPSGVFVILKGFACRYKILPDGERQIMAYMVPGDCDDVDVLTLDVMDHCIGTLSSCEVALVPRETLAALMTRHPSAARALRWATLVDEATLREWLANIGRRPAEQRLAHLFCELLLRLDAVGLADGNGYDFPLTQAELGDTMALSTVHVNRTLQDLRQKNLIELKERHLRILDLPRLKSLSQFNPNYLHLKSAVSPERAVIDGTASAP